MEIVADIEEGLGRPVLWSSRTRLAYSATAGFMQSKLFRETMALMVDSERKVHSSTARKKVKTKRPKYKMLKRQREAVANPKVLL